MADDDEEDEIPARYRFPPSYRGIDPAPGIEGGDEEPDDEAE